MWRYPVKSMAGHRLDRCVVNAMGIPGDRGWALRDEATKEIRGAKRWPILMQCAAEYCEEPAPGTTANAVMRLPDGSFVRTDAPDAAERLSALLGEKVTLWPLQPAENKAHYRRAVAGAAVIGFLCRSRLCRRVLQRIMPYTSMDADFREMLSREPGEPLPDLADYPAEMLEFASPPGTYFDAFPIHLLTSASLRRMAEMHPVGQWDVRRFRPNFFIETVADIKGFAERGWQGRRMRIGGVELQCVMPTARCGMTMHAQNGLPKDPLILRTIVREADQHLGVYATFISAGEVREGDAVELL